MTDRSNFTNIRKPGNQMSNLGSISEHPSYAMSANRGKQLDLPKIQNFRTGVAVSRNLDQQQQQQQSLYKTDQSSLNYNHSIPLIATKNDQSASNEVYMTFSNMQPHRLSSISKTTLKNPDDNSNGGRDLFSKISKSSALSMFQGGNTTPERKKTIRRVQESNSSNAGQDFKLDLTSDTNDILNQFKSQIKDQF